MDLRTYGRASSLISRFDRLTFGGPILPILIFQVLSSSPSMRSLTLGGGSAMQGMFKSITSPASTLISFGILSMSMRGAFSPESAQGKTIRTVNIMRACMWMYVFVKTACTICAQKIAHWILTEGRIEFRSIWPESVFENDWMRNPKIIRIRQKMGA